jgi:opacity protein-like surface antigen
MRQLLLAMVLAAACVSPAAAQDRLEDRIVVNALVGPGFVGESAQLHMRASAGVKATKWLNVVGEYGTLSRMDKNNILGGQHLNANVFAISPNPIYYNLRPYATIGAGTFRASEGMSNAAADVSDLTTNVGAGVTYDVTRWFGVNLDYRRFFVDYGDNLRGKDRWTFGLNFGLR